MICVGRYVLDGLFGLGFVNEVEVWCRRCNCLFACGLIRVCFVIVFGFGRFVLLAFDLGFGFGLSLWIACGWLCLFIWV